MFTFTACLIGLNHLDMRRIMQNYPKIPETAVEKETDFHQAFNCLRNKQTKLYFSAMIVQLVKLKKIREVCHFHHRHTSGLRALHVHC